MAYRYLSLVLACLRQDHNMTQEQFSKEIGLDRSTISCYESFKTEPDYGILIKIADCFKVSTDYLLGRTETRTFSQDIINEIEENSFLKTFLDNYIKYDFSHLTSQLCTLTKPQITRATLIAARIQQT